MCRKYTLSSYFMVQNKKENNTIHWPFPPSPSQHSKLPSRNSNGPCSELGFTSMSKQDAIAFTTGEKRGVTKFTSGRFVGLSESQLFSSCCCKNQVDKRKTGSVDMIAEAISEIVSVRFSQDSLLAARTPWIFATGTSGKVKGDSCSFLTRSPQLFSGKTNDRTSDAESLDRFVLSSTFLNTEKNPACSIPWQDNPNLSTRK